jgi:diguanylate cyclase
VNPQIFSFTGIDQPKLKSPIKRAVNHGMNAPFPPPKPGLAKPGLAKPGLMARLFGRDEIATALGDEPSSPARQHFDQRHGGKIADLCDWLAVAGLDPTPDTLALGWHVATAAGEVGLSIVESARDADGHIPALAIPQLMIAMGLRQDRRALNAMIDQARLNVGSAQALTGESSAAIADYRAAIAVPAKAIDDPRRATAAIAEMQGLTHALLERTLAAEVELRATASVMGELRERLAETQRQALADPLTELPNRRAFEAALADGLAACGEGNTLSVAFVDLDHFKAVNDTHGHAAGDRVLKHVAGLLAQLSGDNCHVARHGGEEFALVFAGVNASEAHSRLDEARMALSDAVLLNRETAQPIGRLSFSAGIAQYHAGETSSRLLARADAALYEAKANGRDQLRIAAPPSGAE